MISLIFGASSGLGSCLNQLGECWTVGRRAVANSSRHFSCDFSKPEQVANLIEVLKVEIDRGIKIKTVYFCAAGGPWGTFLAKEWKDHQWSIQVSLLSPLRVMHELARLVPQCRFILFGSEIAQRTHSEAEACASSYVAAKCGLLGAFYSMNKEQEFEVGMVTLTYMDTQMLPPQARPRLRGEELLSPERVARLVWKWANSDLFLQLRLLRLRSTAEVDTIEMQLK